LPNEFDEGLSERKAVFKRFPQAIPNAFSINKRGTATYTTSDYGGTGASWVNSTGPLLGGDGAAAGAEIFIKAPLVKRVQVSIDVRIKTCVPFSTIVEEVRNSVASLINSNPVGQPIAISSIISNIAVHIKTRSSIDDTLDVFPCHGIGGIMGMIFTGIFAKDVGLIYGNTETFKYHLIALVLVSIFAFFGSYFLYFITDKILPIRVNSLQEEEGLDLSQHAEQANDLGSFEIPVKKEILTRAS